MNRIQVDLINMVNESLRSGTAAFCDGLNNEIKQEAMLQAVLPLVSSDADDCKAVIRNNILVEAAHTEVDELFAAAGIPYVILKGFASGRYYTDPIKRTYGDVDVLVGEQDVERASRILEEAGFAGKIDNGGKHIAFTRPYSPTVELHRRVNGIPDNDVIIRGYINDIIESAVAYEMESGTIIVPDDWHHGLVLLLHTASHLTSEGVGLRHLCDWAVYARENDISEYKRELAVCGLWSFARILSLVSVKYLGIPMRECYGECEEWILDELMADIMNGGNFGQRDLKTRSGEIKYIKNRGERTVDGKSAIRQVWDTVGYKAKAEGRSRAAVMVEYAGLVIKGERKLDNRKMIQEAENRKRLYKELGLFE